METERWLPVVGFEGRYEVSDHGQIKIVGRDAIGRARMMNRMLQHAVGKDYPKCILWSNRRGKNVFVHVVVAAAFIGPKPAGMMVNHKNGDKLDPRLSNLEYVTPSENNHHAFETGLLSPACGEKHWNANLPATVIREIRDRALAGEAHKKLASEYGCSTASVSRYRNAVSRGCEL